ncbi:hypothetical protein [Saccharicrinis aurantiacus]|uniref:hypothetical protein n=1 Tax=Saccharicrinis aurantiacus TaxID=1849719 RepID=UPI0009501F43|nr:hypothetical protein [Saccharicrinis aurantiacus]
MQRLFLSIIIACLSALSWAQNTQGESSTVKTENSTAIDWDMSLNFKTKNVFRGILPSPAPVFAVEGRASWNNWLLGVYGGSGIDGYYQETDFIVGYEKPRYSIRMEYYYNYTQGISDIPTPSGLFDFNRQTTRGLLDFIMEVNLDKEGKWKLLSSTILFGRDTDLETIIVDGESTTRRTDQRYTQYFQLDRTWSWDNNKIQAHIGGSFSWNNPSGGMLYGAKPGIHNVGLTYGKKLKINDHIKLPVKITTYVNPIAETAHVVFAVNLIQFGK